MSDLPSELEPELCAKFVAYLHDFRKEAGVTPVSDEDAVKVFNLLQNWGRQLSNLKRA